MRGLRISSRRLNAAELASRVRVSSVAELNALKTSALKTADVLAILTVFARRRSTFQRFA
jgi:hypothetical protein